MGKCISILGSTGSIGTQSLEVAKAHDMQVHALAANRNITLLEQQTREYHPKKVCIFEESQYQELKQRLADLPVQVLCGMDGLCDIAADKNADILINSVVGMVGLLPTLTAISAGMDVALANKETLVTAGHIIMPLAKEKNVHIYPVDRLPEVHWSWNKLPGRVCISIPWTANTPPSSSACKEIAGNS